MQVPLVDNSVGKKTLLLRINQSMQVENYLNYAPKDDQINKNWTSQWNYIGPRATITVQKVFLRKIREPSSFYLFD